MPFQWPAGFPRVPDAEWTRAPLEDRALAYDQVEGHGWYANLDPIVEEVAGFLQTGDIAVDYSGGTGILMGRLLQRLPRLAFGVVDVDASPKFLRVALEKFRAEERVAFRHLRWDSGSRTLQQLDEVLEPPVRDRGVEAIVSANAVHLYPDLVPVFRSWAKVLKTGGRLFLQSGNIRLPLHYKGKWIIDDTVEAVVRAAAAIVGEEERYAPYRAALDDGMAMQAHAAYRRRVFLPPRALDLYAGALWEGGFEIVGVRTVPIGALVEEWASFLGVYHDAILGWVGGSEKVGGKAPGAEALEDRRALLRASLDQVFGGRGSFEATWTYITCAKRPQAQ